MSENRVLTRIHGRKREEVTGRKRKIREDEPHYWYFPPAVTSLNAIHLLLLQSALQPFEGVCLLNCR